MDRMVKADGEASKAQADATKAQKALRQLEMDVDALRLVSCAHIFQKHTHTICVLYKFNEQKRELCH